MKFFRSVGAAIALLSTIFIAPALAQLNASSTWVGTAGGTSTSLLVPVHNVVALNDLLGVPIRLLPNGINNGASTLKITLDSGGTLGPIAIKKPAPGGIGALTGCELRTAQESVLIYDGTEFVIASGNGSQASTFTSLLNGTSGTYTPPQCATSLRIRMMGGGAGSGGTGGTNPGIAGGQSFFGSTTANGGSPSIGVAGGIGNPGLGGTGGTTGTGTEILRVKGAAGTEGAASGPGNAVGGSGGNGPYGGAGFGSQSTDGGPAAPNTGAGAGGVTGGPNVASGGGGAGEYVEFFVPAPLAASYGYQVGPGGAKSSGNPVNGNAGASGSILIEERYGL